MFKIYSRQELYALWSGDNHGRFIVDILDEDWKGTVLDILNIKFDQNKICHWYADEKTKERINDEFFYEDSKFWILYNIAKTNENFQKIFSRFQKDSLFRNFSNITSGLNYDEDIKALESKVRGKFREPIAKDMTDEEKEHSGLELMRISSMCIWYLYGVDLKHLKKLLEEEQNNTKLKEMPK